MKVMKVTSSISSAVLAVFAFAAVAPAQTESEAAGRSSGLVGHVAKKLEIPEANAEAGTAAILSFAKGRLDAEEFGALSSALPEIDGILKRAGTLELHSLADVTKHLQSLGLEGGIVKSFAPAVIDYVQEATGVSKAKLLRKAMSLRSGS